MFRADPKDYTEQEMINFHRGVLKIKDKVKRELPYQDDRDNIKIQRKVLFETELRVHERFGTIKRKKNWAKDFTAIRYDEGYFPYEDLAGKWSQYIFWLDNPHHNYKLVDFEDKVMV